MAEKTYVSCYDGTLVKVGDRMVRFDKGAALDPHADSDHVTLLEERGMVAEGEPTTGFAHDPDVPAPFEAPDEEKPKRGAKAEADA